MAKNHVLGLLLSGFILLDFSTFTAITKADDDYDRDVTPAERTKIEQVLQSLGCTSAEDMDFEINNNLYAIDRATCQDGKKYEIYLDTNYQVKFKRQDDD